MKALFRYFVDIGASAVIAHHTHVISGYEVYRNAPIFYGLGNFCFDDWPGHSDQGWTTGMAVRLDPEDFTRFDLIPFRQNDQQPGLRLLSKAEHQVFSDKLTELNSTISNDNCLQISFEDYCKKQGKHFDVYLEPYRRGVLAFLRKKRLFPRMLNDRKRRLLLNLTRCESLREILQCYLERNN
jgi:poly-gamma-glutamate synthesis protein (capsule biosynthesis protein)